MGAFDQYFLPLVYVWDRLTQCTEVDLPVNIFILERC